MLTLVAACSLVHHPPSYASPVSPANLWLAATALQDDEDTVTAVFSAATLDSAARALRAVHARFPRVIPDGATADDIQGVALILQSSFPRRMDDSTWRRDVERVAAEAGAGAALITSYPSSSLAAVRFTRPVNTAGMAHRLNAVPGIRRAGIDRWVGEHDGLWIRRVDEGWRVAATVGWGDCPAGCINRHVWEFTVEPQTGRVTLLREQGPPLPRGGA